MKVGVLGLGKLGMPVALAIESRGHQVCGYDINPDVKTYLDGRQIPYREEGLQPLLDQHRIEWCDSIGAVVDRSDIVFIATQTPHGPQYEGVTPLSRTRADFDYSYLKTSVYEAAKACAESASPKTVVVISTCLPGTFERDIARLLNDKVDYAYSPLFIAMGSVLSDYLYPEFNLVGVRSERAADRLEEFFATINNAPCVRTDITTAEGIKVSYNTIITAKTVIANAWGELSERLGMNFDDIKKAWDLSTKRLLSARYLDAGMSDGGGCHPRDNIALSWLADEVGMSHNLWDDLMSAREEYEAWHAEVAMEAALGHRLPLVVLGRAFKPETDLETGSAAMLMVEILRRQGMRLLHVNDLDHLVPAVYFIATKNERYRSYAFPPGAIVIDPFGYLPDRDGVAVRRLGR